MRQRGGCSLLATGRPRTTPDRAPLVGHARRRHLRAASDRGLLERGTSMIKSRMACHLTLGEDGEWETCAPRISTLVQQCKSPAVQRASLLHPIGSHRRDGHCSSNMTIAHKAHGCERSWGETPAYEDAVIALCLAAVHIGGLMWAMSRRVVAHKRSHLHREMGTGCVQNLALHHWYVGTVVKCNRSGLSDDGMPLIPSACWHKAGTTAQ